MHGVVRILAFVTLIAAGLMAGSAQPHRRPRSPKMLNIITTWGSIFFKKGQYDPAIANFTLAIKSDPKDALPTIIGVML